MFLISPGDALTRSMHPPVHLLKMTDWSVTDIANEVGYENVSFFYKKFRETYEKSPKEYRKIMEIS